ncbi:MAG: PRC-barrel domain-containing protein [Halanaerobacter sp.]
MKFKDEIIDLTVIDAKEGKEIGVVVDILFKRGIQETAGLILKKDDQRYLAAPEEICSLGRDYVVIREEESLLEVNTEELLTAQDLFGIAVVTIEGTSLGIVKDVVLTEEGGVSSYELSDGLVQDILTGRDLLTADQNISYNDQKMIVEETITAVEESD